MKKPKLNLMEMLKYRRPARSKTEEAFIERYIDTVPGIYSDRYGNRILLNPESRVMISCHTDTVHRDSGLQTIHKSQHGIISLAKKEKKSNCLGADDTAGIYAALRMIEAGVKVNYIFHRDEEIGGRGSSWLAKTYPTWLEENFDICLAIDRRGTRDIIVRQGYSWGKCASEAFSSSLSEALGMGHASADGIFTDSANYVDFIKECSNISSGYYNEHTRRETLDVEYLEILIERLIKVNWDDIKVERDHYDPYYGEEDDLDVEWHAYKEYERVFGISSDCVMDEDDYYTDEHRKAAHASYGVHPDVAKFFINEPGDEENDD